MAKEDAGNPEGKQEAEVNVEDTLQPWETHMRGPEGDNLKNTLFGGWESAKDNPDADGEASESGEDEDDEEQLVEEDAEDEEEEDLEDPNEYPEDEESEEDEEEESDEESEDEEQSDEEDEQEEGDDEELYKVTLPGGEEAEVTLEELTKGYSRQSDYTRKTQEIAEARKEAAEKRDQYQKDLKALQGIIESIKPEEPDWQTLRTENPAEYAAMREDFKQYEERMAAVKSEIDRTEQEAQQEQQEQLEKIAEQERQRLLETFPEWKDPAVQESKRQELWSFAQDAYGFAPEELQQVLDHRVIRLLNDAQKANAIEGKAETVTRKNNKGKKKGEKKGKKVLKPGSGQGRKAEPKTSKVQKEREEAAARWQKSGQAQDALSLFETFVD